MHGVFATSASKLKSCVRGFSFFFDLIDVCWADPNGQGKQTLHRICTLMRKMGVQSFLQEELSPNDEIEAERLDFETAVGTNTTAAATRITFFRSFNESYLNLANEDILGYAVILTLTRDNAPPLCYILEAVVRPPTIYADGCPSRSTDNYYIHCFRVFETIIGIKGEQKSFQFPGTFFCQQNGVTHVCGHAALRIAINSLQSGMSSKLTNKAINDALGIDHVGVHRISPRGLEAGMLIQFLKKSGFEPHVGEFGERPSIDYEHFIYPIVESACPLILNIANPQISHVVTILGHTFNSDRWAEAYQGYGRPGSLPIRQFISASAWTDHFIHNDDNYGMYATLPIDQIRNILVPRYNPNLYASIGIGLMPGGVNRSGHEAEVVAQSTLHVLFKGKLVQSLKTIQNRWMSIIITNAQTGRLVLRTLLVEKERYIHILKTSRDETGGGLSENFDFRMQLPKQFWVTEITLPDLYSGNKRKIGEILISCTKTESTIKSDPRLLMWLPGICFYGDELSNTATWPIQGHIPLLRPEPCTISPNSEW